mmetsp:Transcript_31487/g.93892  ORF Transcript_31487/g.93892 Transcript_31487/m.93892 type:complete len:257 (+) Transcript_31487:1474-2244(+)
MPSRLAALIVLPAIVFLTVKAAVYSLPPSSPTKCTSSKCSLIAGSLGSKLGPTSSSSRWPGSKTVSASLAPLRLRMPLLPLLSPPTSAAVPVLETDSERCSPAGSGGGWGSDTTAALKRMPKVAWRTVRPTSEEPALSVALMKRGLVTLPASLTGSAPLPSSTLPARMTSLSPPCLCNCPGEPMRRASACVLAGGKPISVSHTASDSLLTIGRPNWIEIDSILVKSPAKDSTSYSCSIVSGPTACRVVSPRVMETR